MDGPTPSKGLIAAAVGVLLLAVVVVAHLLTGNDEPGPEQPSPGAVPTATLTADPPTSDPGADHPDENSETPPNPGDGFPQAAADRAADGILAYTQFSYKDHRHDSWMRRLAKVSTRNFMDSLADTFGEDLDAEREWKNRIVPTAHETRTEVIDVRLETSGRFDNNGHFLTFDVGYRTAVRSINTDGEWTTPTRTLRQWVTVSLQKDGTWLVNDIRMSVNRLPQPNA